MVYIDARAGNDANPGAAGSPKKSFYPVTGGRYNKLLLKVRGRVTATPPPTFSTSTNNLCVEAWDGAEAILTTETDPDVAPFVWTSEGSGAWSAPWPAGWVNTPNNVYAGTVADALVRLTPVGSAECSATPSSFCPVGRAVSSGYTRRTAQVQRRATPCMAPIIRRACSLLRLPIRSGLCMLGIQFLGDNGICVRG